jgi:aminoglycoside phosphotransferase (APT) family kinase protein
MGRLPLSEDQAMSEYRAGKPSELTMAVPATLVEALDPAFLSKALNRAVSSVEVVELLKTVATKVRFAVTLADGSREAYCLKGLLDVDAGTLAAGSTCVLEGDFYLKLASLLNVQVPQAVAVVTDRGTQQSVLIMNDLITAGGQFCSALEPFTADQAAESIQQIANLHAGSHLMAGLDWVRPRASELARMSHINADILQGLLDDPRGANLSPKVRSGARLIAGMKALADVSESRPQFLVHGDAHAGNIFRTKAGAGLIDWQVLQRGTWAIDIAYHLCAVLPVEIAESEERRLLNTYLDMARAQGLTLPGTELAWLQYREAVMYGYFMWGITRRVEPAIRELFTDRLGRAVMRHDSFGLLGVS